MSLYLIETEVFTANLMDCDWAVKIDQNTPAVYPEG